MNSTPTNSFRETPNRRMIVSAILMTIGSLISILILAQERKFFIVNPNFLVVADMVVAFITEILLCLEIVYVFSVLLIRLGVCPYKPKIIEVLAILMLIVNCILFACCFICMRFFEDWVSEGYFTLADIIMLLLIPGIIVKIIALNGVKKTMRVHDL